jgi:hypothetical protein
LEAERLLEGMQMIYASSPDGAKKDSLGMVLAEMTRTFIEKLKSPEAPEPQYEEIDLPFKEGDVFMDADEKDNPDYTFTIKDINFDDNTVSYQRKRLSDKNYIAAETELIVDVADYVESGKWLTYQPSASKQQNQPPTPHPTPAKTIPPQPIPTPSDVPKKPDRKPKRVVDTEKERKIKELLNIDINDIEL